MLSIVNTGMTNLIGPKPKLGVSACLLGQRVRYDGGHKADPFLNGLLSKFVDWVPVCPGAEVGMGIPRETVRLVGTPKQPRMIAETSGRDWTEAMNRYAATRAHEIVRLNLSGYVFKKNSPSCGMERVKVYNLKRMPERFGRGLFAAAVMTELSLLPVEEEGRLNDFGLRENFIERVFAYHRWQQAVAERKSAGALVRFHTSHKYLLLAHSQQHYRRLGRLVATAKQNPIREVYDHYARSFMEALSIHASARTHANVLDHLMGYFSKSLTGPERQELVQLIADFRRRLIPLVVPLTLMRHYVKKYQVNYLQGQVYLEPNPKELMLRNHV